MRMIFGMPILSERIMVTICTFKISSFLAQDFGGRSKNYNENYTFTSNQKVQPVDNANPQQDPSLDQSKAKKISGRLTPTTKLPRLNGAKGEIIYNANEYLDEAAASKGKLTKKKN